MLKKHPEKIPKKLKLKSKNLLTSKSSSDNISFVRENSLMKCDSGVVGNARPCQGRDRGFEPRLSLLCNYITFKSMSRQQFNECDSGVVGNARPCQGRDRGFEPRLSLLCNEKGHLVRCPFLLHEAHPRLEGSCFYAPLRSVQSRRPPDVLDRLSLSLAHTASAPRRFSLLRSASVRPSQKFRSTPSKVLPASILHS